MPYAVAIAPAARRDLKKIPRKALQRIAETIDALADDPRPPGTVKLAGEENLYRVRVGDYRILYEIHDDQLLILVVRVGPRRDIYRKR